jgi:hypothetical protein
MMMAKVVPMISSPMTRRELLALLTAAGATACVASPLALANEARRCFGPRNFAVNMHNSGAGSYDHEISRVLEAGDAIYGWRIGPGQAMDESTKEMRITEHDPLMDFLFQRYGQRRVLVGITDWDDNAKPTVQHMLDLTVQTLDKYPMLTEFEFGNEPLNFDNTTPAEYVWKYTMPVREYLDDVNARRAETGQAPVKLWCAPWHGTKRGIVQTQQMLQQEISCMIATKRQRPIYDGLCVNAYGSDTLSKISQYISMDRFGRPIKVTETGVDDFSKHVFWIDDVMVRAQQMLDDRARRILGDAFSYDHPFVQDQWVTLYDFSDDREYALLNTDPITNQLVPTSEAWSRILERDKCTIEPGLQVRRAVSRVR